MKAKLKSIFDGFVSFVSCNEGLVELVKFLIEHGANVNAVDLHSSTALHKIMETTSINNADKRYAIAELLINSGANVNAKNSDDKTPADLATNNDSNFTIQSMFNEYTFFNLISFSS